MGNGPSTWENIVEVNANVVSTAILQIVQEYTDSIDLTQNIYQSITANLASVSGKRCTINIKNDGKLVIQAFVPGNEDEFHIEKIQGTIDELNDSLVNELYQALEDARITLESGINGFDRSSVTIKTRIALEKAVVTSYEKTINQQLQIKQVGIQTITFVAIGVRCVNSVINLGQSSTTKMIAETATADLITEAMNNMNDTDSPAYLPDLQKCVYEIQEVAKETSAAHDIMLIVGLFFGALAIGGAYLIYSQQSVSFSASSFGSSGVGYYIALLVMSTTILTLWIVWKTTTPWSIRGTGFMGSSTPVTGSLVLLPPT